MTAREQRRVQVLAQVLAGDLKLWEAAVVLGLSIRQTRRLKGALVRAGPAAVAHGNRGRSSPRRLSAELSSGGHRAVPGHVRWTKPSAFL